jgi:hypothetical protein
MTMFQNLERSLRQGQTLKLECEACGHSAAWPQREAIAKLGPDAAPYEIRRKVRCGRCGDGARVRVWI